MTTPSQHATTLASLAAQFKAGTITQSAYATALTAALEAYDDTGALAEAVRSLMAANETILTSLQLFSPDGAVDLVGDLPGAADSGEFWIVTTGEFAGHGYLRVGSSWEDLGLIRGASAFQVWLAQPGNAGQSEADYLEWLANAQIDAVEAAVEPLVAAAVTAKTASEAAATTATTKAGEASDSATAAETARAASVTAKTASETAATTATTKASQASASATAAAGSATAAAGSSTTATTKASEASASATAAAGSATAAAGSSTTATTKASEASASATAAAGSSTTATTKASEASASATAAAASATTATTKATEASASATAAASSATAAAASATTATTKASEASASATAAAGSATAAAASSTTATTKASEASASATAAAGSSTTATTKASESSASATAAEAARAAAVAAKNAAEAARDEAEAIVGSDFITKVGGSTAAGKVAVFSNADGSTVTGRAIGAASATDILDRQAGDARYRSEAQVTAAISAAIAALVAGAPGALDTLNEIATALADDDNAIAALVTAVAGKQAASAMLTTVSARAIGAATATDLLDRQAGDARYAAASHTHAISDVTGLTAALAAAGGGASAKDLARHALAIAELRGSRLTGSAGWSDSFEDSSGVDAGASTGEIYNATDDFYTNAVDTTASWTTQTPVGVEQYRGIAYGAGLYVAVGSAGVIMTSPDAVTWTARTSGTGNTLWGVTFANGVFVAYGQTGTITTSSDGITWTVRTSGTTDFISGAAYGAGIWLIGTQAGTTFTSSNNGVSWSASTTGHGVILNILFVNSLFFMTGGSGMLKSSTNASSWTTYTTGFGSWSVQSIAYQFGLYILVGDNGTIRTTPDLTTFTTRTSGTTQPINEMAFNSGKLVAACNVGTILTTLDGVTWAIYTQFTGSGTDRPLQGIVANDGLYVIVGGSTSIPIVRTAQCAQAAMDLKSVAGTLASVPSKASLAVIAKGSSAITPGTHLTGFVSRDNGANWQNMSLAAAETYSDGYTMYEAYGVSLASQPSGSTAKWRITTTGSFGVDVTGVFIGLEA